MSSNGQGRKSTKRLSQGLLKIIIVSIALKKFAEIDYIYIIHKYILWDLYPALKETEINSKSPLFLYFQSEPYVHNNPPEPYLKNCTIHLTDIVHLCLFI